MSRLWISKASEGDYLFGEEETTVATVPARLHDVLLGPRAKAYVGRKDGRGTSLDEDKSHLRADCAASMTITGSLANTTDAIEKISDCGHGRKWIRNEINSFVHEDKFYEESIVRNNISNYSSTAPCKIILGMQEGPQGRLAKWILFS